MSYWVSLRDKDTGEIVGVDSHQEGGTYALGGISEADLNVTYNYGKFYYEIWGHGLLGLQGQKASDVIPKLEEAVTKLGTYQNANYWAATPGNAGYALSILLKWAKANPDAIFHVN